MINEYFRNVIKEINILFNVPILFLHHKSGSYKLIFVDIKKIEEFFKIKTKKGVEINLKPYSKNYLCYTVNYYEDNKPVLIGYDNFDDFANLVDKALNKIYIEKCLNEKVIRKTYSKKSFSKSRYFHETIINS